MGHLPGERLKGTVRVEFVSNLGLAEAGIDRMGVFKEFMEETSAAAFNPDRGLFRQTGGRSLYPSPSSESADPYHLRYFEFVGRMLGKAIYEGIVLDVRARAIRARASMRSRLRSCLRSRLRSCLRSHLRSRLRA